MVAFILSLTASAVLLRIVANPLSNVFQKQLTQRSAEPLFVISATYGFLGLACLVAWPQLRFVGLPVVFWQSIGLAGLLAMLGNVFLVKALHIGDLSVLGPINAYKSVVGMFVGLLLLHEVPGGWGLAGVGLIVGGSYLVLSNGRSSSRFSWSMIARPEIRLRLAARRVAEESHPVVDADRGVLFLVRVWLRIHPDLDPGGYAPGVGRADEAAHFREVHLHGAVCDGGNHADGQ